MNTRKAIHNPRATKEAPCTCPACVRLTTSDGRALAADWNGYVEGKGARFAIILTGDALAPRFFHGDILLIEPERVAEPGDALLIHFDRNPAKKAIMIWNRDGDLTDLRKGYAPAGSFEIEGVVIARRAASKVPSAHQAQAPEPQQALRPVHLRRARRITRRSVKNPGGRRMQGGEVRRQFLSALVAALLGRAGLLPLSPEDKTAADQLIRVASVHDMAIARRLAASAADAKGERSR